MQPLISIIIPTYNRERQLNICLRSLSQLDIGKTSIEIIVVDDGSSTSCEAQAKEILSGWNHLYLRQKNKGPATARNHGALHASGKFLSFLDDDCTVPVDWVKQLSQILCEETMTGGHTHNRCEKNLFSTASQLLIDYVYQYYNRIPDHAQFLTSNNMTMPAPLFQNINGFSEAFPTSAAEDRELCARWLAAGYKIEYRPETIVQHRHDLSFFGFLRQHFNYGTGAFLFHRKRRVYIKNRIHLEPFRFYTDLIVLPFKGKKKNFRTLMLGGCLVLSQFCNASGFFWEKQRMKRR